MIIARFFFTCIFIYFSRRTSLDHSILNSLLESLQQSVSSKSLDVASTRTLRYIARKWFQRLIAFPNRLLLFNSTIEEETDGQATRRQVLPNVTLDQQGARNENLPRLRGAETSVRSFKWCLC